MFSVRSRLVRRQLQDRAQWAGSDDGRWRLGDEGSGEGSGPSWAMAEDGMWGGEHIGPEGVGWGRRGCTNEMLSVRLLPCRVCVSPWGAAARFRPVSPQRWEEIACRTQALPECPVASTINAFERVMPNIPRRTKATARTQRGLSAPKKRGTSFNRRRASKTKQVAVCQRVISKAVKYTRLVQSLVV